MDWVIGDIHGMFDPLTALLAAVRAQDPAAHFIFAGDYVNRGEQSRQVVDLLLTLPNASFVRGNHDDVFDTVLSCATADSKRLQTEAQVAFSSFMEHGLAQTFMSYGVSESELARVWQRATPYGIQALCDRVPAEHQQFFRALPCCWEGDKFFVVHAYWPPELSATSPSIAEHLAADPSLRETMVWKRFDRRGLLAPKAWGKRGFFGHTPVVYYGSGDMDSAGEFVPLIGNDLVLIDTAVALAIEGMLTAYCPETDRFLQSDREGGITDGKG